MVSQPLVKAVVIINTKGGRVCSRFCDKAMWPDLEAERSFEGTLLKKVQALGEISHGALYLRGSHVHAVLGRSMVPSGGAWLFEGGLCCPTSYLVIW